MNIKISKLDEAEAYIISLPNGQKFGSETQISSLSKNIVKSFDKFDLGDEWWVYVKPA
jgi:hypothetical protein